jgi:hypothetical protein
MVAFPVLTTPITLVRIQNYRIRSKIQVSYTNVDTNIYVNQENESATFLIIISVFYVITQQQERKFVSELALPAVRKICANSILHGESGKMQNWKIGI